MQTPAAGRSGLDTLAINMSSNAWRLDLGPLEELYRRDHRRRAVAFFRPSSLFIFLLYMLMSTGIYQLMPASELGQWLALYGNVGVIIVMAGALSRLPVFDRWFEHYVGLGSFGAVALSVAVTGVVRDPVAGQLTQAAVMYAIVVIYCVTGLRFVHAFLAGWLGGAAGTALAWLLGGSVDWEILHRTFSGASLLGMFIAFLAERRDRELFLQTQLLRDLQSRTEEYAEQLDELSRHDALTGLANRRHFDEALQQEWRRATRQQSPLAVLMIDIDHFKHYNDSLGHVQGDSCLRRVAGIIAAQTRRPGELAVRYGGEEFLLLFPNTDRRTACQLAERLLEAIHEAGLAQAPGLARATVSVSIGVAVATPGSGMLLPGELICAADDALYEAKHAGRATWRYAAGLDSVPAAHPASQLHKQAS
ncbi:MAG: diguanylate cyclase [Moraxellaceae bacterium]|jgi:diguanylate cyclase (GGDEF)-like protein|nr:diguanylate cyclase [Moraxellaceae bacterium]